MPGRGHRGGHHATGKGTRASLLYPRCWDRTATGESCTVRPLPVQWAPRPERGQLEQAEQRPPGGIAVLSHAWAFSPGRGGGKGTAADLALLEPQDLTSPKDSCSGIAGPHSVP